MDLLAGKHIHADATEDTDLIAQLARRVIQLLQRDAPVVVQVKQLAGSETGDGAGDGKEGTASWSPCPKRRTRCRAGSVTGGAFPA